MGPLSPSDSIGEQFTMRNRIQTQQRVKENVSILKYTAPAKFMTNKYIDSQF